MRPIKYYFQNPSQILLGLLNRFGTWLPDEAFLKLKFRLEMGYPLNLRNPRTFNEKLQWLKLYDRRPEYTLMVDKVKAKEYVASIIGEEYIIPTLGVWERAEDVDFDSLPDKFVIKCNHNSGLGMYICRDKSKMDVEAVRKGLKKGLKQNYYLHGREWPYKDVPRRIIAEQFLEDKSSDDLKDYKLMCFGGEVNCSFVCTERDSDLKVTFFDKEWNRLPFTRHYPNSDAPIAKPKEYEKMIRLAERLSKNIPFVRTDFYEVDRRLYFGELTLYPGCGMEEFSPEEWDAKLGKLIKLPNGGGVCN